MRHSVTEEVAWCLWVCLSRSWAVQKTAEPIKMTFGMWTWVGPRKQVLDGVYIVPPSEYDWTIHIRRRSGLFVKLLGPLVLYLYAYECADNVKRNAFAAVSSLCFYVCSTTTERVNVIMWMPAATDLQPKFRSQISSSTQRSHHFCTCIPRTQHNLM